MSYRKNELDNAKIAKIIKLTGSTDTIYAYLNKILITYESDEESFKNVIQDLAERPPVVIIKVCEMVSEKNKDIDLSLFEDILIQKNNSSDLKEYALKVKTANKNKIAQAVLKNDKAHPEDLCKFVTDIENKYRYDFIDRVIKSKQPALIYQCANSEVLKITGKKTDILKDKKSKKYVEKCLTEISKNNSSKRTLQELEKNEKLKPYWSKVNEAGERGL
ncbi:MAG: hypothetical protein IJ837_02305 [Clostridia bacterium]|nr:hypothetical protein [Clostridia bacterium]